MGLKKTVENPSQKCEGSSEYTDPTRKSLTPPGSPDNDVPIANSAIPPESSELKTKRERPKVRRDRARAYHTIERLQVKIQVSYHSLKIVQKRNEHMGKRVCSLEENINTPMSKAKRLIGGANNKKIKKQLTFHNCVL